MTASARKAEPVAHKVSGPSGGGPRHMRRSTSILLACALIGSLFASAAAAQPAADGGIKGAKRSVGDVKPLPDFVRKWMGNKETAADLVARGPPRRTAACDCRTNRRLRPRGHRPHRDGARGVRRSGPRTDRGARSHAGQQHLLGAEVHPEAFPRHAVHARWWLLRANSMHDNYLEMSSGRYTVEGQVSKWVHIDAPESEFEPTAPR